MNKHHFIGIGGIGMSGLANILMEKGCMITGSDISSNYITEGLQKRGAKIFLGHSEKNITPDMTVIYNTDIKEDNPELIAAKKFKCPLMHRSDLLAKLLVGKQTLAVAGTHGKTTTSSLLTWILSVAEAAPSFAVGGIIKGLDCNAKYGGSDLFVIEACESDGTFLKYDSHGAIVTNIGLEHMEYHKNESALISSFEKFIENVENIEMLYYFGDDVRLKKMNLEGVSYGFSEGCKLQVKNVVEMPWSVKFEIFYKDRVYKDIVLNTIGQHNALNCAPCFAMALDLGINEADIREALKTFKGVKRRMDIKGKVANTLFIDDYAHHPTEIKATLAAIRASLKNEKILAVFQPHRYSRTKNTLGQYGDIFNFCDSVIITDIYTASEKPIEGVGVESLLSEVNSAKYIPFDKLSEKLASMVKDFDVCITLGAGSITNIGPKVMELL